MISYAYARAHAHAYLQADIRLFGQLIERIVYKKKLFVAFPWVVTSTGPGGFMICVFIIYNEPEPNALSPSNFNHNEKSTF